MISEQMRNITTPETLQWLSYRTRLKELEEILGDDLRDYYAEMNIFALTRDITENTADKLLFIADIEVIWKILIVHCTDGGGHRYRHHTPRHGQEICVP